MIKRTLPLTYFEKVRPGIIEVYKDFFATKEPKPARIRGLLKSTMQRMQTDLDRVRGKRPKISPVMQSIQDTHNIIARHSIKSFEKSGDIIFDMKALDKMKKGEVVKKDAAKAMDALYLCRMNGKIINDMPQFITQDENGVSFEDVTINEMLQAMYDHEKYGRKQFILEEQLTAELLNTNVNNVQASFLKLPYKAFAYHLPYNQTLTIRNSLIQTVYITEVGETGDRIIKFCCISEDEVIDDFAFKITEDQSLIEQVKNQIIMKYSWFKDHDMFSGSSPLAIAETTELVSFILASILYIISKDAIVEPVVPITTFNKHSKYPACSVGYGMPINHNLVVRKRGEPLSKKQIGVLKYTVIGHFRTYSTAGGHFTKDEVIWIKPFLKGVERHNEEIPIKPSDRNIN